MLVLKEVIDDNYRTLEHNEQVFHAALKKVLLGEKRFHIHQEGGIDYDLEYIENDEFRKRESKTSMVFTNAVVPSYYDYDENDKEKLYLDMFLPFQNIYFEEVNEYTIVIAKILLRDTDKRVWFQNKQIYWFIEEQEKLHIVKKLPDHKENQAFLCCARPWINVMFTGDISVMSAEVLFHNIFLFQWMTDLQLSQVKYVSTILLKTEGIGAVLDHFTKIKNAFAEKNIDAYLRPGSTRFKDTMLYKYFSFEKTPKDANASNTIYIHNFLPLRISYFMFKSSGKFSTDILNTDFENQIMEYYNGILSNKKVLGILIRGTDYINLNLGGTRMQATVEEMVPTINEWIEQDGYEKIFLATEDQDVLEQMCQIYGKKVVAIAQERHRVSDFQEGEYISDVEKRNSTAEERDNKVEDTTVNYFYALYLLSKCDSFMVSGHCNGWDVVNAFNHGQFIKSLKFSIAEQK